MLDLPSRGGAIAGIETGPLNRDVDVVFLHANGFNAGAYLPMLEALPADLRALAIDQRGHGRTTLPTVVVGRRDWHDLADDLIATIRNLGRNPVMIAGHSMGATAAILAAAKAPEIASSLVLFDPVVPSNLTRLLAAHRPSALRLVGGHRMGEAAARRRQRFGSIDEAEAHLVGKPAFANFPRAALRGWLERGLAIDGRGVRLSCDPAWEASNYSALGHRVLRDLRRLHIPVLVVRAEHRSTCGALEVGRRGRLQVRMAASRGHLFAIEDPALVADTIAAQLRDLRQGREYARGCA